MKFGAITRLARGHPGRSGPDWPEIARSPMSLLAPGHAAARMAARRLRGFTLIELILVLAVLAVVLAVSAPALSRFFKGRGLESEARRFMALTRHAQSRAVSEGVPMVLWLETRQRLYGLNADKTFIENDPKAEQFNVDETVEIEVRLSPDAVAASQASRFRNEKQTTSGLHTLRFNPDGFVSPSSPGLVVFRQGEENEWWVAQGRNRLNYEIQSGKTLARR